jgi:hypothetical protein
MIIIAATMFHYDTNEIITFILLAKSKIDYKVKTYVMYRIYYISKILTDIFSEFQNFKIIYFNLKHFKIQVMQMP